VAPGWQFPVESMFLKFWEADRPICARTSVDGKVAPYAMGMRFRWVRNQNFASVFASRFQMAFPIGAHRGSSRAENFFALFAARIGMSMSKTNCSDKNSAWR